MHQALSDFMHHSMALSASFAPEGELLLHGKPTRRTKKFRTLWMIAAEGPNAVYKPRAKLLSQTMTTIQPNTSYRVPLLVRQVYETGSFWKHVDPEKHCAEVERALEGTYHNTPRLPVLLSVRRLNLLEQYDSVRECWTSLNGYSIVKEVICKPVYSPAWFLSGDSIQSGLQAEYDTVS